MRTAGLGREVGILLVGASVYFGGRVLVEGSFADALRNADGLLDVERALGIDIEADLQQLAADSDIIRIVGNFSYVWLHWPLLLAVFWFLFQVDLAQFRRLRNAMFVSGSVGLVLFAVLPMAPPRFMPGYVGTVSEAARRHYLDIPIDWTNRYAAFPSFHTGWTLIACLAVAATLRGRIGKAIAMIPAVLVGVAVVSTGNHYVLDTAAGMIIAFGAYHLFGPGSGTESEPAARLAGGVQPVPETTHSSLHAAEIVDAAEDPPTGGNAANAPPQRGTA